jgi:hypothetical protein
VFEALGVVGALGALEEPDEPDEPDMLGQSRLPELGVEFGVVLGVVLGVEAVSAAPLDDVLEVGLLAEAVAALTPSPRLSPTALAPRPASSNGRLSFMLSSLGPGPGGRAPLCEAGGGHRLPLEARQLRPGWERAFAVRRTWAGRRVVG